MLLAEFGQPPSYQKSASGKQHYCWRHEIAEGWSGKSNFKLKESRSSQPKATLSVHILCRSQIQTKDEDSIIVLPQQTFQKPSTKGLTGDWNSNMAPRGKFLQFSGCFPWLIWLQQKIPGREQRNQTSASRGFGHALCLGGFYLVWLVDFYLGFVLAFWKKIRDGAGSYLGRGTEGSLGHTCSSYGDKRIFFEVGLLLWVPLETTLAAEYCSFVRLPLLRILDYLWLSEFLSHKVDFLSASKRTTGSLTLHYPVYERKQEYKVHAINHPGKYHNSSQMFCQANKPNIGILQQKNPTFCYRATHFITENWIPCFLFWCMVQQKASEERLLI